MFQQMVMLSKEDAEQIQFFAEEIDKYCKSIIKEVEDGEQVSRQKLFRMEEYINSLKDEVKFKE